MRRVGKRSLRGARGFGALGILAAGALLSLGACSLALSNMALYLQSERVELRQTLDDKAKEFKELRVRHAAREDLEHIKREADAMGLVATERVSFYESASGHLTSR